MVTFPFIMNYFNVQDVRGTDLELVNGDLVTKDKVEGNEKATLDSYIGYLQGAFRSSSKDIKMIIERCAIKKSTSKTFQGFMGMLF